MHTIYFLSAVDEFDFLCLETIICCAIGAHLKCCHLFGKECVFNIYSLHVGPIYQYNNELVSKTAKSLSINRLSTFSIILC